MPYYDDHEIEGLRRRLQEFEITFLEYLQIENLIHHAAQGHDLQQYALENALSTSLITRPHEYGLYSANMLLYAAPDSLQVLDFNDAAVDFLGYTKAELVNLSINDLETIQQGADTDIRTYVENAIEEYVYQALYRCKSGQQQLMQVSKRQLMRNEQPILIYRLEDKSLHRRLWYELIRREEGMVTSQHKQQSLLKVIIQLAQIKGVDALGFQVVKQGIEVFGFDRLSVWLLDRESQRMRGCYGVDEQGSIRDERGQSWSYEHTYIVEFLAGRTSIVFAYDESPIYNHQSEIIGYGWHMTAPILYRNHLLGVLMSDNFFSKKLMNNAQKEFLRQYAIAVGELIGQLQQQA